MHKQWETGISLLIFLLIFLMMEEAAKIGSFLIYLRISFNRTGKVGREIRKEMRKLFIFLIIFFFIDIEDADPKLDIYFRIIYIIDNAIV